MKSGTFDPVRKFISPTMSHSHQQLKKSKVYAKTKRKKGQSYELVSGGHEQSVFLHGCWMRAAFRRQEHLDGRITNDTGAAEQ